LLGGIGGGLLGGATGVAVGVLRKLLSKNKDSQSKTASILSDALIGTGIGAGAGTLYGGYTGASKGRKGVDTAYQTALDDHENTSRGLYGGVDSALGELTELESRGVPRDEFEPVTGQLEALSRQAVAHLGNIPGKPTVADYDKGAWEGLKAGITPAALGGAAIGGATGLAVGVLRKLLSKNKDSKVRG